MRGDDREPEAMFSYVSMETRIPQDHPLRAMRSLVDGCLREMSSRFALLYARTGRGALQSIVGDRRYGAGERMAGELTFRDEAAAEYDRAFAHVTAYFMPFLLRAAHLASGMRVLDIATGTGLSAEAALAAVGQTGHVTAADISPAMAGKARERLGKAPNASVSVEDGQALSFSDENFDAVLCNLGLMFFPDPMRGLSELRRVLRPGGRAAVSVNTVVERSYNHQINVIIARYAPSLAEAVTRTFALGEASRLQLLFSEAGFVDIETHTVKHTFVLPSFDAYYGPFERGGASTGQALAALPEEIRRAVREEVRRDLADTGGPIKAEAEYRIASGRR